ncbi:MAG: hypothetical protein KDE51_02830, partial [Anaerolineales bacterium]|nr:hypothetical protein [Anaerolineales bacterium]
RAILKTLSKKVEQRYQSVEQFLADLAEPLPEATIVGEVSYKDTLLDAHTQQNIVDHLPEMNERQYYEQALESIGSVLATPYQTPPLLPEFVEREITKQLHQQLRADGQKQIIGLYGLAAVGKSTVIIQLAYALKEHFKDGILWAKLDSHSLEGQLTSIATAYGQLETVNKIPSLEGKSKFVRQLLLDKHVLLVLDQANDLETLRSLLPQGPNNLTIITSRNRRLLDDVGAVSNSVHPFTLERATIYLTKVLGQERVAAERTAVKELHRLTGGLPLALSIVAGYMRDSHELTIAEYNDILLDEHTRLENLADWEDETRSVAASFELTYQTLPAAMQQLFQVLAIFEGPDFDSQAIVTVMKLPAARVKISLGRLQALSLLQTTVLENEGTITGQRYMLNPLLRLFALEKLGDRRESFEERALEYYVSLALQNKTLAGYEILDAEWENIVGVLEKAYESGKWSQLTEGILALTHHELGSLGFLETRGHWGHGRRLLTQAAEGLSELADPFQKIQILTNLGGFAVKQGDFKTAEPYLRQAITDLREFPVDDRVLMQFAYLFDFMSEGVASQDIEEGLDWLWRGWKLVQQVESAEAQPLLGHLYIRMASLQARLGQFSEAILSAELGLDALPNEPRKPLLTGLMTLAMVYYLQGEHKKSNEYLDQAAYPARTLKSAHDLATIRLNKGAHAVSDGQLTDAVNNYEQAVELYHHMGNSRYECGTRLNIAEVHLIRGEYPAAREQIAQALTLAQMHELAELEAMVHSNAADVEIATGRYDAAAQSLAQAYAIAEELKLAHLIPTILREQSQVALGQKEWAEGVALIEKAISLAAEMDDQEELGVCWRVKGSLLHGQGEPAAAAFEQSLAYLVDQNPYQRALTLLALLDAEPHTAEAAAYHTQVWEIIEQLGAESIRPWAETVSSLSK